MTPFTRAFLIRVAGFAAFTAIWSVLLSSKIYFRVGFPYIFWDDYRGQTSFHWFEFVLDMALGCWYGFRFAMVWGNQDARVAARPPAHYGNYRDVTPFWPPDNEIPSAVDEVMAIRKAHQKQVAQRENGSSS